MRTRSLSRALRTAAAAPPAAHAEYLAPPPGKLRRLLSRSLSSMFKSADVSPLDRWTGTPISPDQFISQRQSILVARSREQWSNNDYVRNFIRLCRQNIVGENGVKLQAKAKKARGALDTELNDAIEYAWREFGKKGACEVTGMLSWRAFQELAVETAARDGEFIVRKVYGKDAGPMGFALQMIDPQRLSVRYENGRFGKDGSFIRQGIEFNRWGRPVAYHFGSTDEADAYYYSVNGRGFVRVPADEIIHGFRVEMVGQRRGLPWGSTGLFRLHNIERFESASVQNARASATKLGFIKYRDGFGPEADDDVNVADTINAEPLSWTELPEGAEIAEWNPTYPSGEYAAFAKSQLKGASAGFGVSYPSLSGDLEGVSFSSIRQGVLDERDNWKALQQWLVDALISPVFDAWLKVALLRGDIKVKGKAVLADKLAQCRNVMWQGRRWTWIDPRADVESSLAAIRGGLNSLSQVISEMGRDPQEVFREFAEDIQQMRAAGIPTEYIELFLNGQPTPKPAAKTAPAEEVTP